METEEKSVAYVELEGDDVTKVVARLPDGVRTMLAGDTPLMLAGGAIRSVICGEPVSDVDLFGADDAHLAGAAATFAAIAGAEVSKTENAMTVKTKPWVQFITKWKFDKPEALLGAFDFTVACAVIWYDKVTGDWKSLAHPQFYADLAAKRIRYLRPTGNAAGGTLLRLMKFSRRGYTFRAQVVAHVVQDLIKQAHKVLGQRGEEYTLERALEFVIREVDPSLPEELA